EDDTAASAPASEPANDDAPTSAGDLVRTVVRPGIGLTLVNFGYVALLSFGTQAASERGVSGAALVVPVFALTVIAARTAGARIPDQVGARNTLAAAAPAAGAGLVAAAYAPGTPATILAVTLLAAGQALAVPALGMLALARVPAARQGAAAGLFFAFF